MKKQWKGFITGVLITVLVLGLIGSASATIGRRTVELDYSNIRIVLDGNQIDPTDANGNVVEPFAINGTTYLPVRAVANALGLTVFWNQETSTVALIDPSSTLKHDTTLLLGFYKSLEDEISSLKDLFSYIQDGSYALLSGEVLQSGPYTGMSGFAAFSAGVTDSLAVVESHYNSCKDAGLLSDTDIELMAEYRRLASNAKNAYSTLDISSTTLSAQSVIGAATQNYTDCILPETQAGTLFWQTYQSAF